MDGVSEAYVSCAWCFTDGQENTVHKREARTHKVPQEVRRLWCLWEVLPEAPPPRPIVLCPNVMCSIPTPAVIYHVSSGFIASSWILV